MSKSSGELHSRERHACRTLQLMIFLSLSSINWAFQLPSPREALIQRRLGRRAQWNLALGDFTSTYYESRLFSIEPTRDGESSLADGESLADITLEEDIEGGEDEDTVALPPGDMDTLPPGIPNGFFVVQQFTMADIPIDWTLLDLEQSDVDRLDLTPQNVSLPIALMLLDPEQYPSFSRSRKACRKGSILIHRGPLSVDNTTGLTTVFDVTKCIRGRVGDRVFPGDVIGKQVRMGSGQYLGVNNKKPPFELPVVYEDDHFALVNKPAGIVVYAHRKGGHGIMTVRAALPFALTPPKEGTYSVIRRPTPVHRLDKPTSGILCIAKTKPAMLDLSRQFRERVIKKTYTAIVNGIPVEENEISANAAHSMGVDVDPEEENRWQLIDFTLEEKSAVTIWKALKYVKSLHAKDGYLTQVELKPKTGRYHQLRRHLAWVCKRPIVGDDEYDGGGEDAMRLRGRGLFLCSNRISLEHPFYNSKEGRSEWDAMSDDAIKYADGKISLSRDDRVMIEASIDLPEKFESLLAREEARFFKFSPVIDEKDDPTQFVVS